MQAAGEDPRAAQVNDRLQCGQRIAHPVEGPMERHLHGSRAPDQIGASVDVDFPVGPQHPDDDAVATQIRTEFDIGGHRLEFRVRIEKVPAPRSNDREQLNRRPCARRRDHPGRRRGAALMGIRAQFDPVGPTLLRNHARRQVESDDLQFHRAIIVPMRRPHRRDEVVDMSKTLIFGHRNPDTDSICSALAYAELKSRIGADVEAVRLGPVNAETQFALDTFGTDAPRLIDSVDGQAAEVILVDHNERQQSVTDIGAVRIAEVIDHHRVANFETPTPLYFRSEPVGSTATIVFKMFREKGVEISRPIAGLMLSAILSDTLLLKSPTCTAEDVTAAEELAAIAGVDLQTYGLDMLRAGASVADIPIARLVAMDAKDFSMSGAKVHVAQVNVIDVDDVLSRQSELETALLGIVGEKDLDLLLFVVTDVLKGDSVGVALGPRATVVESAYGVTLQANRALLKGIVSRKSQIVPVLTKAFAER